MENKDYIDEIIQDNEEIIEDIDGLETKNIVVYSRDWTIETIISQIEKENINLNPKFQRRNAWDDTKRSKLIESLLISYPVPEIVLAEDVDKKKSYIVIDGKQRLLSIAGYLKPDDYEYWDTPTLKQLKILNKLNGKSFADFERENNQEIIRSLENSEIRCTVISNYKSNDVLYDIFYRLNTGSTPLSTQELRQVLNKGDFANYLIQITEKKQAIHDVLNLDGPDKRLKDIEIILRFIVFKLFGKDYYTGNLKRFLDDSMGKINKSWSEYKPEVERLYKEFNESIDKLQILFNDFRYIGRKYSTDKWESRFNKVLFEVELYYMDQLSKEEIEAKKRDFLDFFKDLMRDPEFRSSVESSTKNVSQYKKRFEKFAEVLNTVFEKEIDEYPFIVEE